MSFADLRSARKGKEASSFVSPGKNGKDRTEGSPAAQAVDVDVVSDAKIEQNTVFSQPSGLPTSVNVRSSRVAGRGGFAKVVYSPGILPSLHKNKMHTNG